MLTRDLLRVRIEGRVVVPHTLALDDERQLARAAAVLEVFDVAERERWTRGALDAALDDLRGVDAGQDILRGMAKVLTDRCTFEADAPLDPVEFRQQVFREAAKQGPLSLRPGPMGLPTAESVLVSVAAALPLHPRTQQPWTPAELQDVLYGDLPTEQRLVSRDGPQSPDALVARYNVALVQALLLRAAHLDITLDRPDPLRVRQLLRHLKFHQLMFRLHRDGDSYQLRVDGPQSLLQQSSRYGLQLAVFFPALLLLPGPWRLTADILWGNKRVLHKTLTIRSEDGYRSHYRDQGAWHSNAEKWFSERFAQLETGWSVSPGEPLDLGGQQVLVPDLTFRKDGRIAHLDIVGFWRKTYLERRISETPKHVVLAVSKRLMGDKLALPASLGAQIVPFAEIIPAKTVLQKLDLVAVAEV